MDANRGKIIIDGNAAAALGAMFGGVTVVTWYPITPSSSLVESLIGYMKKYRMGADGKSHLRHRAGRGRAGRGGDGGGRRAGPERAP